MSNTLYTNDNLFVLRSNIKPLLESVNGLNIGKQNAKREAMAKNEVKFGE